MRRRPHSASRQEPALTEPLVTASATTGRPITNQTPPSVARNSGGT